MKTWGMFSESEKMAYTAQDIRFTCRDNFLYATLLAWPKDGHVLITSLARTYPGEIKRVSLVGSDASVQWECTSKGLLVNISSEPPCDFAYVLKIEKNK